jgi:branched-chain amino acid aminotransferase
MAKQTLSPPSPKTKAKVHAPVHSVSGEGGLAYFNGRIVPMSEANVSIATHALNYGTGCFEGIRAYWNAEREQLFVLKLREHFQRFANSRRMLKMSSDETVDELCDATVELLRRQNFRQGTYIRPIAFKSARAIKPTLSGLEDTVAIFTVPMGDYIDISAGLHVCVASWRRVSGNAIPVRAKATAGYLNSALAIEEALAAGYDEAICLTEAGFVSEGSACNLFMVRNGKLHTPRPSDDILEGITRDCVMEMARRELGVETVERAIGRMELYDADELFLTGTGVQISPVTRVEGRAIGDGKPGELTMELQRRYLRAVRGDDPNYADWCTAVYAEGNHA